MIVKMSKYNFVLFTGECEGFVERLRELGLVDVTTFGWEPEEEDRSLLMLVESLAKAERALVDVELTDVAPYATGSEAFSTYTAAQQTKALCESEIARLEKLATEMTPWGEFSPEDITRLQSNGVTLRLFSATESSFQSQEQNLRAEFTLEVINRVGGFVYFVLIGDGAMEVDAQELKSHSMTAEMALAAVVVEQSTVDALAECFARCAASVSLLTQYKQQLTEQLDQIRIKSTATEAADGALLVMEAWAESDTSSEVDALLEEYPNVVYFKSNPTPEDNTPVQLRNGWFSSVFEMIGNLYAVPKYGTIDLTPFFAPFYMLFFAICLCDAGYGAIILGAGVALLLKGGESMRQAGKLSAMCGAAALVFGFLANSFFGMSISALPIFADLKFINFQQDFFNVAMYIGIGQLLLGMFINICVTTRSFGFKYALGSLGWFMLVASSVLAAVLTSFGVEAFGFTSTAYYAVLGISAVLMLFFNSPDKNIFANFGAGIWDTYNNVTGLLGDVLSYIRLFAIGLSGGVLAQVFNSLALGMTGLDQGIEGSAVYVVVLQVIGATIILLLGHGINLFMSTISSFVHPMRLTFVEFYKNAGFEMGIRKFTPLK